MDDPMSRARAALSRHFGYPDFRPAQAGVVRSVLTGQDTLAVLPTGAGKSVCFQVPAVVLGGLTLVVSPLISLMQDQVAAARSPDRSASRPIAWRSISPRSIAPISGSAWYQ
jgi:ATP-dependent DNA helicase RecQ